MATTRDYQGPRRGADRAVLLAHGAGADRHAPALRAVADALEAAGIPSLRFDYPYRSAGRRAPDSLPVLAAATLEAATALARRCGLPPGRVVVGGRSMGGRVCSLLVAEGRLPALGLVCLGYPLHPAGRPERRRVEHFGRIRVPCLFVSGTRDALAGWEALAEAVRAIPAPVRLHGLEGADHGFRTRRRDGRDVTEVLAEVAATVTAWVLGLAEPGAP
jgi:predicted alpha/beta-hydrolase family hydrolase